MSSAGSGYGSWPEIGNSSGQPLELGVTDSNRNIKVGALVHSSTHLVSLSRTSGGEVHVQELGDKNLVSNEQALATQLLPGEEKCDDQIEANLFPQSGFTQQDQLEVNIFSPLIFADPGDISFNLNSASFCHLDDVAD